MYGLHSVFLGFKLIGFGGKFVRRESRQLAVFVVSVVQQMSTTRAIPTATAAFRKNTKTIPKNKNQTSRENNIYTDRTMHECDESDAHGLLGGNEKRSHARTDAITRDGTWCATITVNDEIGRAHV